MASLLTFPDIRPAIAVRLRTGATLLVLKQLNTDVYRPLQLTLSHRADMPSSQRFLIQS